LIQSIGLIDHVRSFDLEIPKRVFVSQYLYISGNDKALSSGAIPKLNFLVSGRISVVMSTFLVFGLCYGRSGNEFCAEEGQNPIFDPLPRNEKLCGNL